MPVPTARLLFWFGLVVLPSLALGAAHPAALGFAFLFVGLVIADLALSSGLFSGISVDLPEVVRLAKDREGAIELRVNNDSKRGRVIRVGLAFPEEIVPESEDLHTELPQGHAVARLFWKCTPRKRGRYIIETCHLETPSRLGFWAFRKAAACRSEVRVYPNLLTERRAVAALFLNRGAFGIHSQRQVGKGREFEKLREYLHGDPIDDIHWKATAKRGHPVTKVFQMERTQEVYVIIDASRLSARVEKLKAPPVTASPKTPAPAGTEAELAQRDPLPPETTTLERFVTSALIIGLAAEQQGDLFGVLSFSDRVLGFVRAKNGRTHYNACRDAIYALQPQTVTPDFDELCSFIRLRMRRALLVFLTALDDPVLAESFVNNMDLICRQHLVLVNMLTPPGVEPLFSNPHVEKTDDLYERLGGHLQWHNLRELEKVLKRRGVPLALLDNEKMSAQLVSQYLNVKRRQLL